MASPMFPLILIFPCMNAYSEQNTKNTSIFSTQEDWKRRNKKKKKKLYLLRIQTSLCQFEKIIVWYDDCKISFCGSSFDHATISILQIKCKVLTINCPLKYSIDLSKQVCQLFLGQLKKKKRKDFSAQS